MHEVVLPSIVFQTQTTYEGHFRENSSRDAEERGALPPCPFRREATRVEVPFHNSIIIHGLISSIPVSPHFINIDLRQIDCSYSRTQKIQNVFTLLFLRSTLLINQNKHIC